MDREELYDLCLTHRAYHESHFHGVQWGPTSKRIGENELLCPDVRGLTDPGVQHLLTSLVRRLKPGQAYVEVGVLEGKTLIPVALAAPEGVRVVGIDNFGDIQNGEFPSGLGRKDRLLSAIARYLQTDVEQYRHDRPELPEIIEGDFREILPKFGTIPAASPIPEGAEGVGLYFYDAAHLEQDHYDGIRLIEQHLDPGAVIVVDDWFSEPDQRARTGAMRATKESSTLELVYEFPVGIWHGGLGVIWRVDEAVAR